MDDNKGQDRMNSMQGLGEVLQVMVVDSTKIDLRRTLPGWTFLAYISMLHT